MSTHNIGFYEDLTKIIFELSSNIIKFLPLKKSSQPLNLKIKTQEDSGPHCFLKIYIIPEFLNKALGRPLPQYGYTFK